MLVTFIFGLTFLLIIVCGLLCFLCGLWRGRKSAHGLENIKGPPRLKQTVIKMAKRTAVFTNGSKPKAKLHVRKGTNYPSDTDEVQVMFKSVTVSIKQTKW